jgi:4-oxalocrotonate tautomerase
MPVIRFDGGKLTKEQKTQLVSEFTETAHKTTGIKKESIFVYIYENDRDNIGVGGELLSDRLKQ